MGWNNDLTGLGSPGNLLDQLRGSLPARLGVTRINADNLRV